ncbi:MAG: 23S rRNA (uracil(1939)-C(5))-methyltransferase RlmD [bacterium]|nr:23S rRNA (uracil(1939)-C(5))-methyltransferase RlmD [bacterium]
MCEINKITSIPNEAIVEIEKLSNLGYGIARIDGFVVFVENACPKDKVKIRINKKNKNFAKAEIVEIINPSGMRIKPFCPMQSVCGACQLQHINYDYQPELKKQMVEDTILNICGEKTCINNVIPCQATKEFRHKVQYPISQTKNSERLIAGYYKPASHELINIKYCPIQPALCDKIIDFIRITSKDCGVSGYIEKKHTGDLKHVLIRISNYTQKALVVLVINSKTISDKVKKLANKIYSELDNIAGVEVNLNNTKTNLILGKETVHIVGDKYVEEKLCNKIFKIGAETFFQVNPFSANNLFNFVKNYISQNYSSPTLLDAYAGISAFGICMSDVAEKVVCVEEVKQSTDLASQIIEENGIKNIEVNNMDASEFFQKEIKTNTRKFDISIIDPPRKGCTEDCLENILKLTKDTIIYVSCNPATLARDLKYLIQKGATVEFIQPFDMFPHTYHIENVAIIKKS